MTLTKLAVFCGASTGTKKEYVSAAQELAEILAGANITLVYGGAKIGLMGTMAEKMLSLGGKVIGVIPDFLLEKEVAHQGLTKLHIVHSMAKRKELLMKLADGFIMLPGGQGTLDEFFEVSTLSHLTRHQKPFGILNTAHYYDSLLKFLDHAVAEKFIPALERNKMIVADTPHKLFQAFRTHHAPSAVSWDDVVV